jgi:hypothetical protein
MSVASTHLSLFIDMFFRLEIIRVQINRVALFGLLFLLTIRIDFTRSAWQIDELALHKEKK